VTLARPIVVPGLQRATGFVRTFGIAVDDILPALQLVQDELVRQGDLNDGHISDVACEEAAPEDWPSEARREMDGGEGIRLSTGRAYFE
jgi:hypothetical protein